MLRLPLRNKGKGAGSSLQELVRTKAHHLPSGRFANPWLSCEAPALSKIIKWKMSRLRMGTKAFIPLIRPSRELLEDHPGPLICFLGHGTVFLKLSGKAILLDPVFGHLGGIVKRHFPPPLSPEDLPSPEIVIYSHAHRDHLDLVSLSRLSPRFLITPLGFKLYLKNSFPLVELDWFEAWEDSSLRVVALPVQHWSKRGLRDTNLALWAGFLIETHGFRLFFGGDTGYFFGFKELGGLFGPFDLALLPCGAFLPRDLMAPFHLSPEEAVWAAEDLSSRYALPIHWGAYRLGDEDLDEPPRLFKRFALKSKVRPLILYPGETVVFSGKEPEIY